MAIVPIGTYFCKCQNAASAIAYLLKDDRNNKAAPASAGNTCKEAL